MGKQSTVANVASRVTSNEFSASWSGMRCQTMSFRHHPYSSTRSGTKRQLFRGCSVGLFVVGPVDLAWYWYTQTTTKTDWLSDWLILLWQSLSSLTCTGFQIFCSSGHSAVSTLMYLVTVLFLRRDHYKKVLTIWFTDWSFLSEFLNLSGFLDFAGGKNGQQPRLVFSAQRSMTYVFRHFLGVVGQIAFRERIRRIALQIAGVTNQIDATPTQLLNASLYATSNLQRKHISLCYASQQAGRETATISEKWHHRHPVLGWEMNVLTCSAKQGPHSLGAPTHAPKNWGQRCLLVTLKKTSQKKKLYQTEQKLKRTWPFILIKWVDPTIFFWTGPPHLLIWPAGIRVFSSISVAGSNEQKEYRGRELYIILRKCQKKSYQHIALLQHRPIMWG